MNAQPGSQMMKIFEQEWTIISTIAQRTVQDRMVCIDFILQLNNQAPKAEVLESRVVLDHKWGDVNIASDHYPIYVDVKLP
jgi:hypothetical protein